MQDTELHEALSEMALWPVDGELVTSPVEIKGGLTNRSFLLNIGHSKYQLRLNTKLATSLGIDREREEHICHQVSTAGFGPKLLFSGKNYQYSLFEYIEGRSWTEQDFRDKRQVARLQSIIERFQRIKINSTARDYRAYLNHYFEQLKGIPCLSSEETRRYLEFDALLEKQSATRPDFVLCHHDLIPENIIETEKRLTIVDWEYASLGHPDLDAHCVDNYGIMSKPNIGADPLLGELIFWLNRLWTELSKYLNK